MNGVGVAPKEIDRSTPPITSKRGPKKGVNRQRAGRDRGGSTPEGRRRLSLAMKKR